MNNRIKKVIYISVLIFITASGIALYCIAEDDSVSNKKIPDGVYLRLNKEFYESLRDDRVTTYSNDKDTEYLREISVSSRFMVETNLQIIRQQEEIIYLLKTIADKNKK
ncbi:MAG: hypothetical protein GX654_11015 [Desulfatiglans sp.]|jgi:hypothetical protein|nr:hypothetical protein [Desulfatiglans sp.]